MATRIPALIQLSDPRVAAQLVTTKIQTPCTVYNTQSHRFQKLDEILQDETVAATMALSLLVRRCVKSYIYFRHISIKLGTQKGAMPILTHVSRHYCNTQ